MGIGENVGENIGEATGVSGETFSTPGTSVTTALFVDNFASGDLTKTGAQGFAWVQNSNCVVVSDPGNTYGSSFAASIDYDLYATAELDFSLGAVYQELWIEWKVLMPADCSYPYPSGNNKVMRLRRDYTAGSYATHWGCNYENFFTPAEYAELAVKFAHDLSGMSTYGEAGMSNGYGPAYNSTEKTFVFHLKVDTAGGGNPSWTGGNGVFQIWNDGVLGFDQQTINNFPDLGASWLGVESGYFMGAQAADAQYPAGTRFLFRRITFAETNIFGVS